MKKFVFVFVSKDNEFKIDRNETVEFEKKHNNVKFNYVPNNTNSLANVYNMFISQHRADKDIDFLVLMHADVMLDIEGLIKNIEEVEEKYDVMGLCGTSIANISQSPLNWWTMSNPTPLAKWGYVTHGELGNKTSFFSSHSPDITDHEVACIDGLCIIFGPKAIASDMLFDNQFMFHLYDTDISFQTIIKYNLKLGVLIEKSLQHFSIGKDILSDDFLKHEYYFRKKWNFDIPVGSRLEKFIKEKNLIE